MWGWLIVGAWLLFLFGFICGAAWAGKKEGEVMEYQEIENHSLEKARIDANEQARDDLRELQGEDNHHKHNHHAKVSTSSRLRMCLKALSDGQWHSSLDLMTQVNTVAIGSCMSELRTNGFEVESRYSGISDMGRKIYEYRIPKEAQ